MRQLYTITPGLPTVNNRVSTTGINGGNSGYGRKCARTPENVPERHKIPYLTWISADKNGWSDVNGGGIEFI